MKEVWKDIEGYEGIYQISNLGRVKSLERKDFLGHRRKEKILKQKINKYGYKALSLWKNAKKIDCVVHKLVASAFITNTENKPQVNHKNGNKTDNRVENLEWCTNKENSVHAWRNGLMETTRQAIINRTKGKGINHGRSKLTEKQVLEIRENIPKELIDISLDIIPICLQKNMVSFNQQYTELLLIKTGLMLNKITYP